MSFNFSFRSLLDSYEKTKRELCEAECTIRRITGRYPENFNNGGPGSSKVRENFSASVRPFHTGRKRIFPYSLKKESRDSSYEEKSDDDVDDDTSPNKKPNLMSIIVAHKHERGSRLATILFEQQNSNSKIKARNRRMFGALIGTLEKFQNEEKKRKHKESKRAEIEEKIEAAAKEESERIKKENELLFVTRQEKETKLRCLEKKIERAESHEVYDINHHYMQKFIKTKSEPPVFFLPLSHTSVTLKCLEESKAKIQELRNWRKECLDNDLYEIEECYKKDSIPDEKQNEFIDECESQDIFESESVAEQEDTGFNDDDDSINTKNVESVTDQDFEPIYD